MHDAVIINYKLFLSYKNFVQQKKKNDNKKFFFHDFSKKITHMRRRWGTPQNLFLEIINELEKTNH